MKTVPSVTPINAPGSISQTRRAFHFFQLKAEREYVCQEHDGEEQAEGLVGGHDQRHHRRSQRTRHASQSAFREADHKGHERDHDDYYGGVRCHR